MRDFKLLTLLSKDKAALATARRLGGGWAPQPPATNKRTSATAAHRAGGASASAPAASGEGNARQRRSAKRAAARRKKQLQTLLKRTLLAVLFIVRLCIRQRVRFCERMHQLERSMIMEHQLPIAFSSPKRGRADDDDSTPAAAPGSGSSDEAPWNHGLPRHTTPPRGPAKSRSRWGPACPS